MSFLFSDRLSESKVASPILNQADVISTDGEEASSKPRSPSPVDGASASDGVAFLSIEQKIVDPEFYIDSGVTVFEVEGYMFRVPTYRFFKESPYFVTHFALPKLDNHPKLEPGGASATIVLPADIPKEDFRVLLKALFPSLSGETMLPSLSQPDWISMLKFATKWRFNNLREMAISHLENLQTFDALDLIVLGRECYISWWLVSGLTEMVTMDATIRDDEVLAMGYPTAVEVLRKREWRFRNKNDYYNDYGTVVMRDIETKFSDELLSINAMAETLGFKLSPVSGSSVFEPSMIEEQGWLSDKVPSPF